MIESLLLQMRRLFRIKERFDAWVFDGAEKGRRDECDDGNVVGGCDILI